MSFDNLQPGQRVGMVQHNRYSIGNVTRITPTRVYVNGMAFVKRTGLRVGDRNSYSPLSLSRKPIEEVQERIEQQKENMRRADLITKITKAASRNNLKQLNDETLSSLAELLGVESEAE